MKKASGKHTDPKDQKADEGDEESQSGDEHPETDAAQPDTATGAAPARISGEELKAKQRQERRETRLKEKGY